MGSYSIKSIKMVIINLKTSEIKSTDHFFFIWNLLNILCMHTIVFLQILWKLRKSAMATYLHIVV